MAFRTPNFNLTCAVWRTGGIGGVYAAPAVQSAGNLSAGARGLNQQATLGHAFLLLPKLTDVRAFWNGAQGDLVEVPAGSKRFYSVQSVEDVGKGFANEYRVATIAYQQNGNVTLVGGPFAAPVPLP